MERLLGAFLWQFVLVYVDDIIIYSPSLKTHLYHLDQVLKLLDESGVTLSLAKCHFAYPSIKALGHHVSRLGVSTLEEKVEAVRGMSFPSTLRQLETGLGFFGYYRKFVPHYAAIARPLMKLKTRGFKDSPPKGQPRRRHAEGTKIEDNSNVSATKVIEPNQKALEAWETLKDRLCSAPTLAFPDFHQPFILYTDGSKEKGFGAALHQIDKEGMERPILFLSRDLSNAETRYWATELEAGALVWALTKLPQYFDDGPFTVVTDHSALKSALQTKTTGRRSNRLNEWSMYLSTFLPRMKIVHRPGTSHGNADGLSRLPVVSKSTFPVTIIRAEEEFLSSISEAIPEDPNFGKLFEILKKQMEVIKDNETGPNTVYQSYRLDPDSGLLYMVNKSGPDRMCISKKKTQELLQFAHDNQAHGGIHRTYDRLRLSIYFPKMRKTIQEYIDGCPACQLLKPTRLLSYGQLQSIPSTGEPLEVLSIDFIVALPMTGAEHNCLMTVTDKFSKFVQLLPGKETYTAKDWAERYFDTVYRNWGIPHKIISDRDPKFTSEFWQALFGKCGVKLALTTAYHPSADGQAERTNQTVETALRCLLVGKYEEAWDTLLPQIEYALNTFPNAATNITPFEVLYSTKPRDPLFLMTSTPKENGDASNFLQQRQQIRAETDDAIKLAQAKIAIQYDVKHRVPELTNSVYLKMAKTGVPGYHLPKSSSLSTKKVGPFKIAAKVGPLAYRLELPESMKIHPVISVIHLEQAKPDSFGRQIPEPTPLMVEGEEQWVIEKILKKERRGRQTEYRVKMERIRRNHI